MFCVIVAVYRFFNPDSSKLSDSELDSSSDSRFFGSVIGLSIFQRLSVAIDLIAHVQKLHGRAGGQAGGRAGIP